MPELPEVETIARFLREGVPPAPPLVGRRILSARLLWPRTLAVPGEAEFLQRVAGQDIEQIGRRGKFLVLRLSRDSLLLHLRMSGDLRLQPVDVPLAVHDRLVLDLDGGWNFIFNDARKFGRAWLVKKPEEVLQGLGPEPFDPAFTPQEFYRRLQTHHRQLKPLLLDQEFIAGLGNIYADEALNLAGLHPLALSHHLSQEQSYRLWEGIRQALQDGIRHNGSSIDWVYRGGGHQEHFRVYQRTGEPCLHCGAPIARIVVGQRSTHFCPVCQPYPE